MGGMSSFEYRGSHIAQDRVEELEQNIKNPNWLFQQLKNIGAIEIVAYQNVRNGFIAREPKNHEYQRAVFALVDK